MWINSRFMNIEINIFTELLHYGCQLFKLTYYNMIY